jgi:hypothetical protein
MRKFTQREALRHAGLISRFLWEDEHDEGLCEPTSPDSAYIIGELPEKINNNPVYIVHVDGTAYSTFGYSYEAERDLKIWLKEDGDPISSEATDEDIEAANAYTKVVACKDYARLMSFINSGATNPNEQGDECYEDMNIGRELRDWNRRALSQGLQFVKQTDGSYALEAASQEAIDAYEQSLEEEEEEE